jgi:hypothetical protein
VYFCQWRVDGPEHDANVDLVIGPFGEATLAEQRVLVALLFRRAGPKSGFMVIDAAGRHSRVEALCGAALARDEVVGTSRAASVFESVDAIWDQDVRIERLIRCE